MEKCSECIHYDDSNSYKDTGYCHLYELYVKDNNSCCNDFEEAESYGY